MKPYKSRTRARANGHRINSLASPATLSIGQAGIVWRTNIRPRTCICRFPRKEEANRKEEACEYYPAYVEFHEYRIGQLPHRFRIPQMPSSCRRNKLAEGKQSHLALIVPTLIGYRGPAPAQGIMHSIWINQTAGIFLTRRQFGPIADAAPRPFPARWLLAKASAARYFTTY